MSMTLTTRFRPGDEAWTVRRSEPDGDWIHDGPFRVDGVSVIMGPHHRRELLFFALNGEPADAADALLTEETARAEALLRNNKEDRL